MRIELSLYGAFRDLAPGARLDIHLPDDTHVADLRRVLREYADRHWPAGSAGLLARSAFASAQDVLRDSEALPADGCVAVLPPVSGG